MAVQPQPLQPALQPSAAPTPMPAAAPAVPPAAVGAQALLAQFGTAGNATVSVAELMQHPEILQHMLAAAQPKGGPPQGQVSHATWQQQQPGLPQ